MSDLFQFAVIVLLGAIAWYARKFAINSLAVRREIECLHEDLDRRNHYHDEAAMESEIKMDEDLSALMSR